MKTFASFLAGFALVSLCVACDSGDSSSDTPDAAPTTVTSTVLVTDWVSTEPIEGATLCLNVEGIDCVDTDAEGTATFDGEPTLGETVQMKADKDGYFPFMVEFVVSDATANAVGGYIMAPGLIVDVVIDELGEEPNDEKGHAGFVVWGPADDEGNRVQMVGATMTLDGTASQGPKYYNLLDSLDAGLFAPDEDGTTAAGMAGFFNVDPGTVAVTVTAEGHDCSTGFTGLPGADGSVQTTVEAGRISYATVFCDAE
ncbi:MAG: hypothetical protein VX938_03990 [Myxococcota bacterium]|nr:hypothetical protein [Myxococcota bacterium]